MAPAPAPIPATSCRREYLSSSLMVMATLLEGRSEQRVRLSSCPKQAPRRPRGGKADPSLIVDSSNPTGWSKGEAFCRRYASSYRLFANSIQSVQSNRLLDTGG